MSKGKNCCQSKHACMHKDLGLLVLRIGFGVVFAMYGYMKLKDMGAVVGFFSTLGFPAFLAYLVAYVEFLGGIAVILGVFTRIASSMLAVVMAVVLLYVKWGAPLVGAQGVSLDVMLFVSAVALIFIGGGRYALAGCGKKGKECIGGVCEPKETPIESTETM